MSSSSAPTHVAESIADRKKSRDLHEARQAGTAAPEVDIKTGAMINPHNPEFITKRPWYLGGGDDGPSLDHQSSQLSQASREGISLTTADALLQSKRLKSLENKKKRLIVVGSWVEALRRNKKPYVMCRVTKVHRGGKELDLKYDDGYIEKKVRNDGRRIKLTNVGNRSDIATDDAKDPKGKETYDSKRDKYHGFDTSGAFTKRLERRFATRDALRRQLKKSQEERSSSSSTKKKSSDDDDDDNHPTATPSDSDSDLDSDIGSDSDDEFVQRDEDAKTFATRLARQGGVGGAQMKVTARNLRIREDTAKYLRNLDLNSAFYDPKSRSMRDNPIPDAAPEEVPFAGDNFARVSGDAITLAKTQLFAWEAQGKGISEIHPQANPSQAELLEKKFNKQSDDIKRAKKTAVLAKYGGAEHLDGTDGLGGVDDNGRAQQTTASERKVRFGVSTEETTYTRDGRIVNSNNPTNTTTFQKQHQIDQTSKYDEDVYVNAHTTVWGSYFHKGAFRWGYADDHSLMKNSYGTGANGRTANDDANEMRYGTGVTGSAALKRAREMLKALPSERRRAVERPTAAGSRLYGEARQKVTFDEGKLETALAKAKEREMEETKETGDKRKRKYNSMTADDVDVTEEDMEAYRLRKGRGAEDPMARLGTEGDKLLDYK